MEFTQITFLFVFLPISIFIYHAIYTATRKNLKVCNVVLVCESLAFFWWAEPKLLLFFTVLTVLMHMFGNRIYAANINCEKKKLLVFAIAIFVLMPILYKYLPSIRIPYDGGRQILFFNGVIIPIGISFFTLEAISYLVDIYTERALPGSIVDSFVFLLLFPKAMCGPVVLWKDISPQLYNRKTDIDCVRTGIQTIITGYAKKVIIADTFAATIALIDSKLSTNSIDSLSVWLLGLLFFFRIYYDFSGYSDIAIGLCNTFGFKLEENFNRPYLSDTLTEFWRRWHISLGRWFKEYVYIPIGGNRQGRIYLNILITFLAAGLWHGWRITVVLWAVLNGIIVIAEKKACYIEGAIKVPKWCRTIITILIVYFGWILFRSPDLVYAGIVLKGLFIPPGGMNPNFTWRFFITLRVAVILLIAICDTLGIFDWMASKIKERLNATECDILEKVMHLVLFAVSIMFLLGTSYVPFIYSFF